MIRRGCYYAKNIQVKTRSDGQPEDISTWQFEANLLDQAGATALAMSTGGGQFVVFDGANGRLRFALTPAETTALVAGPVSAEVYRTDAAVGRTYFGLIKDIVQDQA